MKKKFWLFILAALILSPMVFATGQDECKPQGGCFWNKENWELTKAICELADSDVYVRRNAARAIKQLTKDPDINRAVHPLISAITVQEEVECAYNRALFLSTLGLVVGELGDETTLIDEGINTLSGVLSTNNSDLVRCGAAGGLQITLKENAIAPLEYALENDPSAFVRSCAEESLNTLKDALGIEDNKSPINLSRISFEGDTYSDLERYTEIHFVIFGNDE